MLRTDLASVFGDWRQSEKLSEIKPPLTFEGVILKLLLYIDNWQSVRNTVTLLILCLKWEEGGGLDSRVIVGDFFQIQIYLEFLAYQQ